MMSNGEHYYTGHIYIGHNYIDHIYIGHNYIGHIFIGHDCIGLYYIVSNYIGARLSSRRSLKRERASKPGTCFTLSSGDAITL